MSFDTEEFGSGNTTSDAMLAPLISRCPICPARNRCVGGDGPRGALAFCIGEAPGFEEDKGGVAFSGAAGLEYNVTYLPLAGLHRSIYGGFSDVYTTNVVKCRPSQNKKPTDKEAWGCGQFFLPQELKDVDPTIVILMGATACKILEMNGYKRVDLEAEHGIPRRATLWEWEGWVVPINHPASGLHDSGMMIPMLEDWEKLEAWIRTGRWQWAEDRFASPYVRDYGLIRNSNDLWDYLQKYQKQFIEIACFMVGGDTESHAKKDFSMQFSIAPGTGRMILSDNIGQFYEFGEWFIEGLKQGHPLELVLHNADADLNMFERACGNKLEGFYRDTMQEAYQFANLPQKLKALARRLLGRIRPGWEELVTPPSRDKLIQWMMAGFSYAESNWTTKTPGEVITNRVSPKTGKKLKDKIVPSVEIKSEAEKKLAHIIGHAMASEDYPADMSLWKKVVEMVPVGDLMRLVTEIGPMPQLGIANCELDDAVHYGCSDADDTLTLAILFKQMRKKFVEKMNLQEEDIDEPVKA